MLGSAAELDYILTDIGDSVAFTRGATTIATTHGILDTKQLLGESEGGLVPVGHDTTLVIRDGTEGSLRVDDVATVTVTDKSGVTISVTAYRVRDLGLRLADGSRRLTIAG